MSAMVGNTIRKGIFDTDSFSSFKPEYANSWAERKECSNNYSYSHEHYINEVFCPSQVSKDGYTNQKKCTFPYAEKTLSAQMDKINEYSVNESIPEKYFTCNADTETAYEINYPTKPPNGYNNLEEYLTIESQREIQRPDLELVYIHFASMIASASWQLFATSFSLPVSGTHSIIGALVGGALASSAGHKAVTWSKIGGIVLSWVTSPTLSCIAAYFIYRYIGSNIIQSNDPILAARRSFPVFMGICMFLNGYALVLIQLKPCQPTDLDFICNWPTQEFTASMGIGHSYRKYVCSLVYAVPFGLLIWFLAKVFAMPFYEKKDQELLNCLEIPAKFAKTLSSERLLTDRENNNYNNMKLKPIQSLVKIEEEEDSIVKDNSLEDSESDPKVFSSETHAEPDARTKKDSLSKKDSVVSRTDSFRVNLLQKQLSEKRDSDISVPNSPVKLGRFVVNSVDPNTPRKTRQPSYKAKSNFLHDLTVQTLRPAALKYHKSEPDMYLAGEDVNYFSYPFRQGNHANNLRANHSHHTALGAEHGNTSNPTLSPKKRTGSTSGVFRNLSHKLLPKHGRTRHVSDSVAHNHPSNIARNNPTGHGHIVTSPSLSTRNSGNNLPEMNNSLPANGLSRNASSFDQKSHLVKIQESESDFTDVEHEECAQNPLAYRMKETKSALKVSGGGTTPQTGGMFTMGGADEECESREFLAGDHEDAHQLTGHSIGHSEVAKTARFDIEKNETVQYVNKVGLVVESYFKRLQVLAACCSSLAHGGNDTANAIAPLIGIFLLFVYGPIANDEKVSSNQWLFAFGGLFMSLGLFCLGRRCIETMGEGITEIVPSSGFTTSMVAVLSVQISTICGMPVSSTHCQVGAVIGIGLIGGWRSVKWSLMKNVALAWILTLPATGLISYVIVKILVYFSPGF